MRSGNLLRPKSGAGTIPTSPRNCLFAPRTPWLVVLLLALLAPAAAQSGDDAPSVRERPSVRVPALAADERPEIDGVLNEDLWRRAVRVGPLSQVLPIEGAPTSYDTDVRLCYDRDTFYVGLRCYDDPREVRARQMDRDAFVRYDDVVELWLDPFASERFAYWFQITPGGSIGDALIADNGTSFNKDWDGIWYGRSRVDNQGWTAELAIPMKTLAFDPDAPWWGFNVTRRRVANGESSRWAAASNAYRFFQTSEGGKLFGLEGLRQGVGLDVIPYLKLSGDRATSERSFGSEWDVGVDVRFRPTPTSTLLVTTNTDFAETEVDVRQINTNRFPLFFPERRDFFLEDAGVFEFGTPSNRRSLVPFFTRRIGRSDAGEVVPIFAGAKFTGRVGDWTIGALDTYVGDLDARAATADQEARDAVEATNLGVLRVQRSLGDGQQVGMIATSGDPGGDSGRTTLGLDALLGSTRQFGEGHSGFLWTYVLGSTGGDTPDSDGLAYGMEARSQSRNWQNEVRVERIEENFRPALGFVRRTGFDRASVESEYTWRATQESGLFRQVRFGGTAAVIRDRSGSEDSWSLPIRLFDAQFWSQDSIGLRLTRRAETIDTAFGLGDGAVVGPGDYDETRVRFEFESNDNRRVGLESSFEVGDFFGGTIERLRVEPIYIPSKHLTLGLSFQDVTIDLGEFDGAAGGRQSTELYSFRVDVDIDPFTSWRTLAQYETDDKDLSVQSRVRWILEPGRELFLVGLFGFDKEDSRSSFVTADQSLAVKLELTFRF